MMVDMPAVSLMRARSGEQVVTNIEVFFDLVFAFAVTQLSHYLLEHATVEGALQTALLLAARRAAECAEQAGQKGNAVSVTIRPRQSDPDR